MKKLMFTFIAIVGFSFSASAECDEQFTTASTELYEQSTTALTECDAYSTQVCGNCYSVQIPLTGFVSVDAANYQNSGGTMRRKPNIRELTLIIDAACW